MRCGAGGGWSGGGAAAAAAALAALAVLAAGAAAQAGAAAGCEEALAAGTLQVAAEWHANIGQMFFADLNVTNAGAAPVRVEELAVPSRFSGRVREADGSWAAAPEGSLVGVCGGPVLFDPRTGDMEDACPYLSLDTSAEGYVQLVLGGIELCPGCRLVGGGGGTHTFELYDEYWRRMEAPGAWEQAACAPLPSGGPASDVNPGADSSDWPLQCFVEENANYKGEIVVDGSSFTVSSAGECCAACLANERCNTWNWCPSPSGCFEPYKPFECYLKYQEDPGQLLTWSRGPFTPWLSGVILPQYPTPQPPLKPLESSLGNAVPAPVSGDGQCLAEANANYKGEILVDGASNIVASAEECCAQCLADARCNVWVFCAAAEGCYDPYKANECYLKYQVMSSPEEAEAWSRGEFTPWTSGVALPGGAAAGGAPESDPLEEPVSEFDDPAPGVPETFEDWFPAPVVGAGETNCRTLVPDRGMFAGVYPGDGKPLAEYRNKFGKSFPVYGIFVNLPLGPEDERRLDRFAVEAAAQGALVLVSAELWQGYESFTQQAAQKLVEKCSALEKMGSACIVRFAHEANASWYPWAQRPTEFKRAFRSLANLLHAETQSSSMMWSVNYGGGYPWSGGAYAVQPGTSDFQALDTNGDGVLDMWDDPYAPYYPGDDVVDWVGMTLYHWNAPPHNDNSMPEPKKFFQQVSGEYDGLNGDETALPNFYETYAVGRSKPMAISETSAMFSPEFAFEREFAIKSEWMQQLMRVQADKNHVSIPESLPELKLVMWFDHEKAEANVGGAVVDWTISNDKPVQRKFSSVTSQMHRGKRYFKGPTFIQKELARCQTSQDVAMASQLCHQSSDLISTLQSVKGSPEHFFVSGSIQNPGSARASLKGLGFIVYFSRGVKDANGFWFKAPPGDIIAECQPIAVMGGAEGAQVACDEISIDVGTSGIVVTFGDVELCPGCYLSGTDMNRLLKIFEKNELVLDFVHFNAPEEMGPVVSDLFCGSPADMLGVPGLLSSANIPLASDINSIAGSLAGMDPVGAAHVLESMDPYMAAQVLQSLHPQIASNILAEMEPSAAAQVVKHLPFAAANSLLESMPRDVADAISKALPKGSLYSTPCLENTDLGSDVTAALNVEGTGFDVKGSISNQSGQEASLSGVVIDVKFGSRVVNGEGRSQVVNYNDMHVFCDYLVVMSGQVAMSGNLCNKMEHVFGRDGQLQILFEDIVLCSGCKLVGDMDGTLLRVVNQRGHRLDPAVPLEVVGPTCYGLSAQQAVQQFSGLSPDQIASEMQLLNPQQQTEIVASLPADTAADVLELFPPRSAAAVVASLPSAVASAVLQEMDPNAAAAIMAELPEDVVQRVLDLMSPVSAAGILSSMEPYAAAEAIKVMGVDSIVDIVASMSPDAAAAVLAGLPPRQAADVLANLTPSEAAPILTAAPGSVASTWLSEINPQVAADILETLPARDVFRILEGVPPAAKKPIMNNLSPDTLQGLLSAAAQPQVNVQATQQCLDHIVDVAAYCKDMKTVYENPQPCCASFEVLNNGLCLCDSKVLETLGDFTPLLLDFAETSCPRAIVVSGTQCPGVNEMASMLQDLDPDTAAAVLESMPLGEASAILQSMPPNRAGPIVGSMAPDEAALLLESMDPRTAAPIVPFMGTNAGPVLQIMQPEAVARILENMAPQQAASILNLLDPSHSGTIIAAMDPANSANIVRHMQPEKLAPSLTLMNPDTTAGVIAQMPLPEQAALLTLMDPSEAAEVLQDLPAENAALILVNMPPTQAVEILSVLPADVAADVVRSMTPAASAPFFDLMEDAERAAEILGAVPLLDAVQIVELMNPKEAAEVISVMNAADAATLVSNMTPSAAAGVIEYLEPRKAADIFESLTPLTTAQIFSFLPKEDAAAILSLMPAHLIQALETAAMLNSYGMEACTSTDPILQAGKGNLEFTLGSSSTELLVTGQVSQASSQRLDMTGLTVSWQFPGWVQRNGSWQVASADEFVVECTGAVMPTRGVEEDVCEDIGHQIINGKFTIAFGKVDLCPSCSIQGKNGGDEPLFTIRHKDGLPLDIRASESTWGCYFDNSPVGARPSWTYSAQECELLAAPVEESCSGADFSAGNCCGPLTQIVGTTCMCTFLKGKFDRFSQIAADICGVAEDAVVSGPACQALLSDPKVALAALPPEEAAKYLLTIPKQVAAEAISAMNPEEAASIFEFLSPAEAAGILGHASPQQSSAILELLPSRTTREIMDAMPPEGAANILSNAKPDIGANILGLMEPESAAAAIQLIPPGAASEMLAAMAVQDAREILQAMPADLVPGVLQQMDPKDAAAIVAGLQPALAAEWLQQMPPGPAGDILKYLGPSDTRRIVNRMDPVALGNAVHAMGPDGVSVLRDLEDQLLRDVLSSLPILVSSSIIELASSNEAADILERAHPATTAGILMNLSPVKAAEILELMNDHNAGAALADMSVSSAASIVQYMNVDPAAQILRRLPPSKQQEILMRLPQELADAIALRMEELGPIETAGCPEASQLQASLVAVPSDDSRSSRVRGSITNYGAEPQSLAGIVYGADYSRWARGDDLVWIDASPAEFQVMCEQAITSDEDDACSRIDFTLDSKSILMDLGEIELCSGCALTLDLKFSHKGDMMLGPNAVRPFAFVSCESIPDFTPAVEAASDFSEAPTLNEIILQSQMLLEFESAASNDTNFEYTIGGQVSQTTGNALNLNGLIIPVQFSPWVKDASGPWLQVPFDEFEFECVALRDPVTRQDFCDTVEFVTTDEGVNIAFGNVVLCPSCSLTGDENGVMFTIRHKGGRELDFRAPVIQSPFLAGSGMSLGDAGTPVDAGAMETEFGNGARGKQCSADSVRVCSGQGNALVPSPAMSDLQPMFEAQMSSTMPASVLTEEERASPELFVSGTVIASGFSTLCLEGVSVLFRMPLTVFDSRGVAATASPDDFIVTCRAFKVAGPVPDLDTECDRMVSLSMTDMGVLATFHGVDLCDSCWLVGGANGVFFSVQHTQGFELTGPVEALPPSCLSMPPTSTRR